MAGAVVDGGITAYDTYQTDTSQHPEWSEEHKIARAGVKGVTTGGATFAMGIAGAKLGAAVGAACSGPFAPVGALVGGSSGESPEDWQGTTEASTSAISSMSKELIVLLKRLGKVKYARESNRLPVLSGDCTLRFCRLVCRDVPGWESGTVVATNERKWTDQQECGCGWSTSDNVHQCYRILHRASR